MPIARIVRATEQRMPEVAQVFKASFRATYPAFPELHTAAEDLFFFKHVVFEKNTVYVAEEPGSGRILGFIAFGFHRVEHLYLLPEAQGAGLGAQLLELAQRQFTDHGRKLELWTFQANARAIAFCRRHGFVVVRETDGAANEEKQPDVLLEWSPGR